MPLCIGDPAPDFTIPNQDGVETSLSSFKGSRVVIYFYPKDDTPGCTKEACSFRDRWDLFKSNNIQVLGISKDASKSHIKFIDKYKLPFTLLTDNDPCPVATLPGVKGGQQYGPRFNFRGAPKVCRNAPKALNHLSRKRLWDVSKSLINDFSPHLDGCK